MLMAFKIVNFKGILNFECSEISYFVSLPKNLNIEQKTKYLEILKYSFLCEDWQTLHSLGRLLNYNKIVEYLLDKELFEKDESIEKISEEKIQFLQDEMKLKSNLSLESCEIDL